MNEFDEKIFISLFPIFLGVESLLINRSMVAKEDVRCCMECGVSRARGSQLSLQLHFGISQGCSLVCHVQSVGRLAPC